MVSLSEKPDQVEPNYTLNYGTLKYSILIAMPIRVLATKNFIFIGHTRKKSQKKSRQGVAIGCRGQEQMVKDS